MTRHAEVERSPLVKQAIPALAALAHMIGDPAVRNRGTLGGSISNNDPAADYPAAVVGLNATVHTTKREIAADNFFTGMFETALEPAEIVTSVRFPKPQASCYQKFRNPASRSSGNTFSMKYGSSFLKLTNDTVAAAKPASLIRISSSATCRGEPTIG